MKSTLNWAIEQTARKLGLKKEDASLIYKSYWKFIKEKIHELELEDMSEKDFQKIPTNFNIPYIGKLYTNYEKIQKYNRKVKYLKDHAKVKDHKTSV